jgi:hypothetical protein
MNRRLFIYSWPLSSCDSKKWAKNLPSFFLIPNPQVMSTCVESSQCNYVILHQNPLWSSYNVCEQGLTCLRDWVHPRISQLISTLLRKLSNWAVVSCSSWPDWKVDFYLGTSWTQVWSTNGQRSATLIISMIWYSSPSRCRRLFIYSAKTCLCGKTNPRLGHLALASDCITLWNDHVYVLDNNVNRF